MKKIIVVFVLISCLTSFSQDGKPGLSITDVDGNIYKTVIIGTQTWMAENLKTSRYNDGNFIPNIKDSIAWSELSTGAWCYHNNNEKNNVKYGKLYNWYAVNPTTNGNKNVCPNGWHVPSAGEWTVLSEYLGGDLVAGGKLKGVDTTNWDSPNVEATNTSLFTGLPFGGRAKNGVFYGYGYIGHWWSSTDENSISAWYRDVIVKYGIFSKDYIFKKNGMSIRCLKD